MKSAFAFSTSRPSRRAVSAAVASPCNIRSYSGAGADLEISLKSLSSIFSETTSELKCMTGIRISLPFRRMGTSDAASPSFSSEKASEDSVPNGASDLIDKTAGRSNSVPSGFITTPAIRPSSSGVSGPAFAGAIVM